MFGYISGLVGALRGKLSSGYKNQLQTIGMQTRVALTGILTGDQGMFLHHPLKLDDPSEMKRFKDTLRALWMNLPLRSDDWAAWAYRMENEHFKGSGLSLERTAFGVLAALVKMEMLASAIRDYPDEHDMIRHITNLVRDNFDSFEKLMGDDAFLYLGD